MIRHFGFLSLVAVLVAVCTFPHRHPRLYKRFYNSTRVVGPGVLSHVRTCLFRTNNREFRYPRTWLEIARVIFFTSPASCLPLFSYSNCSRLLNYIAPWYARLSFLASNH
jgi:hypothetical protein